MYYAIKIDYIINVAAFNDQSEAEHAYSTSRDASN